MKLKNTFFYPNFISTRQPVNSWNWLRERERNIFFSHNSFRAAQYLVSCEEIPKKSKTSAGRVGRVGVSGHVQILYLGGGRRKDTGVYIEGGGRYCSGN
jgi:hypothetical protein